MFKQYNIDPGLKRCNTPTLLERDFPSEVVSVGSLTSMAQREQENSSHDLKHRVRQSANMMVHNQDVNNDNDNDNDNEEGSIYFQPKRIYKLNQESRSTSTLVRVYSENETSNFNDVIGTRMYDDFKYRPIRSEKKSESNNSNNLNYQLNTRRRYSSVNSEDQGFLSNNNTSYSNYILNDGDMQDEYIPDFDFAESVRRWQVDDFVNSNTVLSRYSIWNSEDDSELSPLNSASSSLFLQESHAQVEPIPFPNANKPKINDDNDSSSRLIADRSQPLRILSSWNDPGTITSIATLPKIISSRNLKRHTSRDFASSLSLSSTTSLIDKISSEELQSLAKKIPQDFMLLPYTQRKKILMKLAPGKDYNLMMNILKKYSFSTSQNLPISSSLEKRSRRGSLASQFLNSFTPSSSSFRPDEKNTIILGQRVGKIIGFGAWGMIRDCYDCDVNNDISGGTLLSPTFDFDSTKATKVLKIVKFKNNLKVKNQVLQEISIWKQLHHKNILTLLNWKIDDDFASYCLTEKVHDGTLYDLVTSWGEYQQSTMSLNVRCLLTIQLILQVISALKYMHSKFIVHGDVKLENCLLEKTGDNTWKILICDFGMSRYFSNYKGNPNHNTVIDKNKSIKFRSPIDGTICVTTRYPTIPTSVSHNTLRPLTKVQSMIKKISTHDDTPLGISSFPKRYGPSLTSTKVKPVEFTESWPLNESSNSLSSIQNLKNSTNLLKKCKLNENKNPDPDSHIGSLPYAAPELIEPNPPPLGPSADIWAMGVTLYTMLIGKLAFKHEYEPRLRAMIVSGKYDVDTLRLVCNCNEKPVDKFVKFQGLFNAIKGCLTKDITQRWELDMVEVAIQDYITDQKDI